VCYTRKGLLCDVIFAKYHVVPQLVYKDPDQLPDKMSDSDESFDILRDIEPYGFEPLAKKVTDSINREELDAASAYVDPDQPSVPPTLGPGPQQELDWCVFVCVGIRLIDKSTQWA